MYRLDDYASYLERVGSASYIDISRRTDPGRIPEVWKRLDQVVERYGAPWIAQIWTKNPAGVLALGGNPLTRLLAAGTTITAQVTITGLAGTLWEPLVPKTAIAELAQFCREIGGPDHITWRYDPIIPTVHRRDVFVALADQVAAVGIRRAVMNFLAPPGRYKRVDRRLSARLPGWDTGMPTYTLAWRESVATELVAIARERGISVACCAESASLTSRVEGLRPAACGDYDWFARISGREPGRIAYRGSRGGCGCAPYFDVGSYGQWAHCHRCVYCYAG